MTTTRRVYLQTHKKRLFKNIFENTSGHLKFKMFSLALNSRLKECLYD